MSEKLTRIKIPNTKVAIQDWGEKSAKDMVSQIRSYAASLRKTVEAIEATEDAEFQIDVVRGPYVQHHVKEIQKSSLPSPLLHT